jgi:hypothetical protein
MFILALFAPYFVAVSSVAAGYGLKLRLIWHKNHSKYAKKINSKQALKV